MSKLKFNWKYALGEVLFIFIGISMAMGFQNWNENRKEREFEKEILLEIKESMALDSRELALVNTHFKKADQSILKSLHYSETGVGRDSLRYWFADFINFDRFNPATSAYEVLKSKGLQIVRNKELRLLIAEYYDNGIPKITQALSDVEVAFKRDIVEILRQDFQDIEYRKVIEFNNIDDFFGKKNNVVYIKLFRDNRRGAFDDLENGINLNNKIVNMINKVLNP